MKLKYTDQDLKAIAQFNRVIKNYIILKQIESEQNISYQRNTRENSGVESQVGRG